MKRRIGFVALLLFLALNAGCPYTTRLPLGVPDHGSFDTRLVGLWMGYDGEEAVGPIRVFAFNDAEYYIEAGAEGDEPDAETDEERNDEPDRYRAFVFKIDGQVFLQINELGENGGEREYCFARYSLSDDGTLEMRFVAANCVPKTLAADPQGLRKFIAAHLDDPALDDEDVKLLMRREE